MTIHEVDIAIRFDGEFVPARELSWALITRCDCVIGLHSVLTDVVTEDDAWKAFYPSAAERKQWRDRGVALHLLRRDEACDRAKTRCEHTPEWGFELPMPDGYGWAAVYGGRVLHLIPESAKRGEWTASLCRAEETSKYYWSRDPWDMADKADCRKCIKAAAKAVSA